MIPEVANHLINSGGKRLRPMLTLALAQLAGYAGDGHIKLAAAVEFMHTATLLHDDVVDESEMRRGRLAARMLWGNEASVLVGDFLLGQAFKMMVEVGILKALEILSSAAAVIAEGEVMQLAAAKNTATTEDEYLAVIRAKTAELFAAACEVGPALARGRNKAEQAACRSFGMNLGIAFQLVDDALDYGGSRAKLGKNVGDDFREGKITLPVVLAFRRGGDAEREFWRRTLERGEATDADLEHAIGLMTKHRALEDTIGRAQHYGAIATRRARAVSRLADEGGARPARSTSASRARTDASSGAGRLLDHHHHAKCRVAAEHRFDGALDLQQAARHAGAEQTPALESAAQRVGRERKPVDPPDAQAGKQPMKSLTVPRRQKRRNRLVGVVRIAARGGAAVDQNIGRGTHRLLVQETIEQCAAPGDGRFHHQHAAAGTQHPLDLAKEGDREFDVMQHVHHDNVGGTGRGERQTLRIGDAIEPRRELDVGRDNVAETLFQVADAAADLDGRTRPACATSRS